MTRQNADYGYEIQRLYLELMLSDAETFVRCQSIFDHTLFDRKLQNSAKFIEDYVSQYNIMPTYDIVNASTGSDFNFIAELNENHYNWLLEDFETFIRHKGLERAILETADLLEQREYGAVEEIIKRAVQIGLTKDLGTDYFSDPRGRLLKIKDNNGQVSSGWPTLDRILYGGFNRGELNIFAGQSGAGKSIFLANFGVNYAVAGLNVVYLTFELSEGLVSMRIDSMLTGIPSKNIFKNIDDVELQVRMVGKKSGALQVKYMPSGKTVNDVRAFMKELEIKTGRKIDVMLVDYLDLLMPASKKISAENLYIKDKYVSEELRNLAVEKGCVLITASQLGRSSVEETVFDHSHIAGGISKIQTADNVLGIYTSRALRDNGKYQIQLMKTRNSSGVGNIFELDFNIDTLRIADAGEEYESMTDLAMSKSAKMVEKLTRKSSVEGTVLDDTQTDIIVAPKVSILPVKSPAVGKVQTESTKMRELLAEMRRNY